MELKFLQNIRKFVTLGTKIILFSRTFLTIDVIMFEHIEQEMNDPKSVRSGLTNRL